jgi:hypothetical protein
MTANGRGEKKKSNPSPSTLLKSSLQAIKNRKKPNKKPTPVYHDERSCAETTNQGMSFGGTYIKRL